MIIITYAYSLTFTYVSSLSSSSEVYRGCFIGNDTSFLKMLVRTTWFSMIISVMLCILQKSKTCDENLIIIIWVKRHRLIIKSYDTSLTNQKSYICIFNYENYDNQWFTFVHFILSTMWNQLLWSFRGQREHLTTNILFVLSFISPLH